MRLKELKSVKSVEQAFEFLPLSDYTDYTLNAVVEDNSIKKYVSPNKVFIAPNDKSKLISAFLDKDKIYLYFSDGKISVYSNGKIVFTFYLPFDKSLSFIKGTYMGKGCVFAVNKEGFIASLDDNFDSFKVVEGEGHLYFNDRFFAFNKNKLYFADNADSFLDFISKSIYMTDKKDIVAIEKLRDKLIIFTKSVIYSLEITGEDFKLSEVCSLLDCPIKGSVKAFDDRVCYLSKNGVYVFDGKKIEKIPTVIDGKAIDFVLYSTIIGKFYVVECEYCGGKTFLAVSLNDYKSTFIAHPENLILSNGCFIDEKSNVYDLSLSYTDKFYWVSKRVLCESVEEKIIYAIEVLSEYASNLLVLFDGGEVSYSLIKGYNYIGCNIKTRSICLQVAGSGKKGKISALKIFYRA